MEGLDADNETENFQTVNETLNNILTASRMNCFLRCQRQHFWQCEVGLVKVKVGVALRFGSAWARATEYRWHGKTYDEALAYGIPEGVDLDEYDCAKLAALLAAYYDYYGPREQAAKMHPEVQFDYDLGIGGFTLQGKLDALGTLKKGGTAIVEGKTTGESLHPKSTYWLRLAFNVQLCQYVLAARREGWSIDKVFYDVVRKPSIKPKMVPDLDENKLKIILDKDGNRVFNESGKHKGQPRQSASEEKGYVLKEHLETPDEYCDRLYNDALKRPDFYFARKEVSIVADTLKAFERQRLVIAKQIMFLRSLERSYEAVNWMEHRDPEAWPRNVSKDTCNYCQFKDFCIQNIPINLNHPPEGFEIRPFNPELQYETSESTDLADTTEQN